jgi:hypothetical protein
MTEDSQMAKHNKRREAEALPPFSQPSTSSVRHGLEENIRKDGIVRGLQHVDDLYQDILSKIVTNLARRRGLPHYDASRLLSHGVSGAKGIGDEPMLSFLSYRSDEKEFREWLIKKYGPITDDVPEVGQWLSEIDRSIERMRRDQEEIDRLKEETRAAIARLQAA